MVASANDYRTGDSRCGIYSSIDHGHTWTNRGTFSLFVDTDNNGSNDTTFDTAGNPVVRSGRGPGVFYYSCHYFDRTEPQTSAIAVFKTINGGATWAQFTTVASGTSIIDFNDKP